MIHSQRSSKRKDEMTRRRRATIEVEWDWPPRRQLRRRQSRTETLVIDHDHIACNQDDVVELRKHPRGWASPKVTRAIDIYFKIVVFIIRALISAFLGLVILACIWFLTVLLH